MFDWVPLPIYANVFYHTMLALTLMIGVNAMSSQLNDFSRLKVIQGFGIVLFIWIVLYMGLRPVTGKYFIDMGTYNRIYESYQAGAAYRAEGDVLFNRFMWLCAQLMPARSFFFLVDIIYIVPLFLFSKKYFKRYWVFCFFMFLASFSFWSYGTNGIRNGMATSLFIMGLYFYNHNKVWMYAFFILAFYMHASLVITLSAFIVSFFLLKKPKWILGIWLLSIPLSLAGGNIWAEIFESMGFFDDRAGSYLSPSEEAMEQFSQTGFRWDFLLYSASAIYAGWYFIFKRKLTDKFYIHLFGIYAIGNAIWILVIDAAFSNRFAYLSWFLMAPVIIYPICKYNIVKNQYKVLGAIILLYFGFTYFMFLK